MISYRNIFEAQEFYSKLGYQNIDAPWFVSSKAIHSTSPPNKKLCQSHIGFLVASGEQSFIEMWLNGDLKFGIFQCTTPCFRDELFINDTHHNYFIKVELIQVLTPSITLEEVSKNLGKIITDATQFFINQLKHPVEVIKTDIGWDIISNGIELGSYGYRVFQDMKWIYGTGCAEPRLSYVLEKENYNARKINS